VRGGWTVSLPLPSALLPAEPKLPLDKHTLYCLLPPTLPFNPVPNLAGLQFGSGGPMLVVGTLDVNQGTRLPAEELMGRLPEEGDKRRRRAYISNVATWAGARRQGVARRMLQEAMREAAAAGVHHLYGER
jgi:ribosomal protein S18 acetylase RimI-like enzyme